MAKIELTRLIQNSNKGLITYNEVLVTIETNFIIAYMKKNESNINFSDNVTTLYLAGGPLQFSGGPGPVVAAFFSEMDVKGTYADIKELLEEPNTPEP
tara:strand:- start:2864 stop:3157 length:294 start_codon:yes stop_codon:yes gene_type:complete